MAGTVPTGSKFTKTLDVVPVHLQCFGFAGRSAVDAASGYGARRSTIRLMIHQLPIIANMLNVAQMPTLLATSHKCCADGSRKDVVLCETYDADFSTVGTETDFACLRKSAIPAKRPHAIAIIATTLRT